MEQSKLNTKDSKLKLIKILMENRHNSIYDIMFELGITRKEIRRYLRQISRDGFILKKDRASKTYWIETFSS